MDHQHPLAAAETEMRRRAYLEALGVDTYVSRSQLPGAAVSRRLVIMAAAPQPATPQPATPQPATPQPATPQPATPQPAAPIHERRSRAAVREAERPAGVRPAPAEVPSPELSTPAAREDRRSPPPREAGTASAGDIDRCRFTLVAIVAGGFLWLEELRGVPLAREQLALVHAMARAMGAAAVTDPERPAEVTQFTWPMHDNAQFDQGEAAARAALGSFLGRKLEQHRCRGIIALGDSCARRIPLRQLPSLAHATLPATLDMLSNPRLKKDAWNVLASLATTA